MCGISGYLSFDTKILPDELKKMNSVLAHRGPDSSGFFIQNQAGLAHNRLAILDLSTSANQPFFSSSGRYVISYNGEVYNYRELIKEFNLTVKTSSDTEVILELFERKGIECVKHFNGMFAFAIYDTQEQKLYIVRDRMGLKPIYYYKSGHSFVFASEMKALTGVDSIRKTLTINQNAISSFLHLGYVPDPYSIYNEIEKVPAGTVLTIGQHSFTSQQYWKLEALIDKNERQQNFDSAKASLNSLVESSVKLRLISDVPLGIFLSGGIDSSLIAAIAKKNHSGMLKTFTVGYKDSQQSELHFAKKISDYLGTQHHELLLEEKEAIEMMDSLLEQFDEPFADSSMFPTYFISRYAAGTAKTILAGEGADELFMGYGSYNWPKRLEKTKLAHSLIGQVLKRMPSNRYKKSSLMFSHYSAQNPYSHVYSQDQGFFSEKELEGLLLSKKKKNLTDLVKNDILSIKRPLTLEEKQAFFDLKYSLPGDLLTKIDRASMACSLEVREPFLDYRIIDFAMNLPVEFKVQGDTTKYILKEVLYDYIPREYFDRPKQGFSIPLEKWLKKELGYLINQTLSKESIEDTGLLDYSVVENLIARFEKGENYLYNRLWAMIVLQKWMMRHKNN